MKTTPILLRVILFAILILSVTQAFPQSKFEISGGLGLPVFTNLRIKYGNDLKIGACIGIGSSEEIGSTTKKIGIMGCHS